MTNTKPKTIADFRLENEALKSQLAGLQTELDAVPGRIENATKTATRKAKDEVKIARLLAQRGLSDEAIDAALKLTPNEVGLAVDLHLGKIERENAFLFEAGSTTDQTQDGAENYSRLVISKAKQAGVSPREYSKMSGFPA